MPNAFGVNNITTATAAFSSTASCVGSVVAFTGTTTPVLSGATATWNFGDPASGSANAATGFTPTHTYTSVGTYQVTLTVTQASLATPAVITQAVTVAPLPRVQLGRDTTLCGSQLLLAAGAQPAGTTYRWQDGSTAATYLARATGIYSVTVTSAAGCASTASRQVTLNALPTPRLPADTAACGVASILLRLGAQPAGATYRWQDGSTSATYLAQVSGTYSVQVTTAQGCVGTATSRVQLGVAPTVRLGADTLVCPNAVWTLRTNPQPAGTLYRWQDGSTGATYVARGPGQYSVEVRASATGCPATATLRAGAANCPILIPNIITPNNDQQNDFFVLKGLTPSEWSLRIFDRWGRQVYDQPRYDNRWNAEGQSEGLYYYILLHNTSGERHQGWVEVVRGS
jgi:gliding motility-associated-like protein